MDVGVVKVKKGMRGGKRLRIMRLRRTYDQRTARDSMAHTTTFETNG